MSERKKLHHYDSADIEVTYDAGRCIHAKECVRRLADVFDTSKRPWVQPQNAAADQVAGVIETCPTGALHYTRKDGGPQEAPPRKNVISIMPDGPLYLRGKLNIGDENAIQDTRAALCRCGESRNKPFCDNSHIEAHFTDPANPRPSSVNIGGGSPELKINPAPNGPLLVSGSLEIINAGGNLIFAGDKAALCRCGHSSNKPFCDGTHRQIGFKTVEG